jgi:hypothetical protein
MLAWWSKRNMETIRIKGRNLKVEWLGGGAWTKAYRRGKTVYAKVQQSDYTKSIALGYPSNPHLPKIEFLEHKSGYDYYKMPLYHKPDYGSKDWQKQKDILDTLSDAYYDARKAGLSMDDIYVKFLENLENKVPASLFDAMTIIVESLRYIVGAENFSYDLGYSNSALDDKGNFILLDPFAAYDEDLDSEFYENYSNRSDSSYSS